MSVMRSSLLGSLLQVLKFNLDRKAPRVRVFELGRVFLRDDTVATTDSTVKGIHQPMRVAGLAWGDAEEARWDGKAAARRLLRRQGRRRGAARAAACRASSRSSIRRCIRAARRACCSMAAPIGVVGELHPRWRQKWEFAQAPVLFELDLEAVDGAAGAGGAAGAQAPGGRARHRRGGGRGGHARRADAAPSARRPTPSLLRDAALFDIYRPPRPDGQRPRRLAQGEKSMAVRLQLQQRRRHADRRAGRGRGARRIDSSQTRRAPRLRRTRRG